MRLHWRHDATFQFSGDLCDFGLFQRTATPITFAPSPLILTGFLESSTSRILRFSNGIIPRGSLSCRTVETESPHCWHREPPAPPAFLTHDPHPPPLPPQAHRSALGPTPCILESDQGQKWMGMGAPVTRGLCEEDTQGRLKDRLWPEPSAGRGGLSKLNVFK